MGYWIDMVLVTVRWYQYFEYKMCTKMDTYETTVFLMKQMSDVDFSLGTTVLSSPTWARESSLGITAKSANNQ